METLIKEFPGKYELDAYLISEIFDKALKEKSLYYVIFFSKN